MEICESEGNLLNTNFLQVKKGWWMGNPRIYMFFKDFHLFTWIIQNIHSEQQQWRWKKMPCEPWVSVFALQYAWCDWSPANGSQVQGLELLQSLPKRDSQQVGFGGFFPTKPKGCVNLWNWGTRESINSLEPAMSWKDFTPQNLRILKLGISM